MKLEKTMFREYDIRGLVDKELTEKASNLIGRGFGTFLVKRGIDSCVVGHDARHYSERLKNAFIEGISETGVKPVDIGLVLTPIAYFAQVHLGVKGCAMITASHNPNGWSGFKLGYDIAKTLLPEDINELYKTIEDRKFISNKKTSTERYSGIIRDYIRELNSRVKIPAGRFKIVINARNGTASEIAPELFRKAGCRVVKQFCDIDFSFPNGNADPSLDEMLLETGKKVVEEKADLGLAFDGDGDRLGVVDNLGNKIYPDKWLILLAKNMLKEYPGSSIVFDVKCTKALQHEIEKNAGKAIMWKTGHSHIKKKAHEIKAALAGERSGHVFFLNGYYGYDDACFAGLKLLEYLTKKDTSISELMEELPKYYSSPVYHAHCDDTLKYKVVEKITEILKERFGNRVNDINGARVEFNDGFGLVRASSNLPALVLVFEAKTEQRLKEIMELFRNTLKNFKEIGPWETGG